MLEDGEEGSGEREVRYVWDPQKLAWVEAAGAPPKEVVVEPWKEPEVEQITPEEVPGENVQAEVLAGESVPEYKGMLIRVGGVIIDFIILLVAGIIVGWIAKQFVDSLPFWSTLVYSLLYFVGFWSWRGQTPGKMLIGAKVVRRDGSTIGLGWSLLRYLVYLVPFFGPIVVLAALVSGWFVFMLPLITLVVTALTREKRGIHDFVAGTVVINTRGNVTEPVSLRSAEFDQPDKDNPDTPETS